MKTYYTYTATISNANVDRRIQLERELALFPKYLKAYLDCGMTGCCGDKGSICLQFNMDAITANALRKWFKRRGKGRAKWSRSLDPVNSDVHSLVLA
jgi:hypothetical protein